MNDHKMQEHEKEEQRKFMTQTGTKDLLTQRQMFNRYAKLHRGKFE